MKILAAAGAAVVVLGGASGVAMATVMTSAATHTTAKACVASNGALRLTKSNGKCPVGLKPFSALAKGGPGTALGYVHVKAGGFFDAARSYNVKASNINSSVAGFYCIKGLPFTPHSVQVTMDYNGLFNGQLPAWEVQLPPDHVTCPSGAQVMIFTGLINPTVFTNGKKLGFFAVFY